MAHIIREISIKDVEDFIKLLSKIYDESEYTLYNPGEYTPSISSVSDRLERIITSQEILFMLQSKMINWLVMHSLRLKILSVNVTEAVITIGVRQLYQKHGIGMALVNATELGQSTMTLDVSELPLSLKTRAQLNSLKLLDLILRAN